MTPVPECIDALVEAASRLDESPSKAQYEELGLTPSSATIIRQLGSWNAAKEAAGLTIYPSTGSRVQPKPEGVIVPDGEAWAELSVDQRWHYRNVEWNTERTLRRRATLRRWINGQKGEQGCDRCGRCNPAYLDYHHRNGTDKRMDIGTMVTYGYGRDTLKAEIEKCVVLCANCHRMEHHGPPTDDLRAWVWEQKRRRGGCSRCSESHPARLDFHHVTGDKTQSIAKLVADDRSRADIRSEMEKCVILCANCHREEHFEPPTASLGYDNHK